MRAKWRKKRMRRYHIHLTTPNHLYLDSREREERWDKELVKCRVFFTTVEANSMELYIWNINWDEAVQVDPDNYGPAQVKAQVKLGRYVLCTVTMRLQEIKTPDWVTCSSGY